MTQITKYNLFFEEKGNYYHLFINKPTIDLSSATNLRLIISTNDPKEITGYFSENKIPDNKIKHHIFNPKKFNRK